MAGYWIFLNRKNSKFCLAASLPDHIRNPKQSIVQPQLYTTTTNSPVRLWFWRVWNHCVLSAKPYQCVNFFNLSGRVRIDIYMAWWMAVILSFTGFNRWNKTSAFGKILNRGLADLCDSSRGWPTSNTTVTLIEQSHSTHYIATCYNFKTKQTNILKIYKFQNEVGIDKKYWTRNDGITVKLSKKIPTLALNNL